MANVFDEEDCDCGACESCAPDWWHADWSAREKPDEVDLAYYLEAAGDA